MLLVHPLRSLRDCSGPFLGLMQHQSSMDSISGQIPPSTCSLLRLLTQASSILSRRRPRHLLHKSTDTMGIRSAFAELSLAANRCASRSSSFKGSRSRYLGGIVIDTFREFGTSKLENAVITRQTGFGRHYEFIRRKDMVIPDVFCIY